jgi:glycosyl transferase family 25
LAELLSTDLSVLRETFDQIYVLTLDRATDRHAHVKCALQGIDYRFFSGIDKSLFASGELKLEAVYDDAVHRSRNRTHRSMSAGEVACALSHRAIHQDALEQGYARILILEDDVALFPEYLGNLRAAMGELPSNWESLMLGYYSETYPGLVSGLKLRTYSLYHRFGLFNWGNVSDAFLARLVMQRYSKNIWQLGKLTGGHAYALTLAGCRKLVELQTPVFLQADRVFSYAAVEQELQAYALDKKLFGLAEISELSWINSSD